MKASKVSEAQIAFVLRQAEGGTAIGEVCRKAGISEATFYNWRRKYAGLVPSEKKRLRHLEEENGKLKKLVGDLSLDKAMLQDVLSKKLSGLRGDAPSWTRSVRAGRCRSVTPAGCCGRTRRPITTRLPVDSRVAATSLQLRNQTPKRRVKAKPAPRAATVDRRVDGRVLG